MWLGGLCIAAFSAHGRLAAGRCARLARGERLPKHGWLITLYSARPAGGPQIPRGRLADPGGVHGRLPARARPAGGPSTDNVQCPRAHEEQSGAVLLSSTLDAAHRACLRSSSILASRLEERVQKAILVDHHEP